MGMFLFLRLLLSFDSCGSNLFQAAVAAVAVCGKGWKGWPLRHMLRSMHFPAACLVVPQTA
jgi:hypothetical protein